MCSLQPSGSVATKPLVKSVVAMARVFETTSTVHVLDGRTRNVTSTDMLGCLHGLLQCFAVEDRNVPIPVYPYQAVMQPVRK